MSKTPQNIQPEETAARMIDDAVSTFRRMPGPDQVDEYARTVKQLYLNKQAATIYSLNGRHPNPVEHAQADDSGPVLLSGKIPVPPPPRFIVDHYVPEGHTSVIAGAGGAGKSYLMMHMAVCLSMGAPFLGLNTIKSQVLYVDFEENDVDFHRRVIRILNGMGFRGELPGLIQYWHPGGQMLSAEMDAPIYSKLREYVVMTGAEVLMIDSLTAACDSDVKEAGDTTRIMSMLKTLAKTVIVLDHIPHNAKNNKEASPYGSVMKENKARSVMALTKDKNTGVCSLRQTKQNETAKGSGVDYKMSFSLDGNLPGADYSWNSVRFDVLNPDEIDPGHNLKKIIRSHFGAHRKWPSLDDIWHTAADMGLHWARGGGAKDAARQRVRRHINDFCIDVSRPGITDEEIDRHKGGVYAIKDGRKHVYGNIDMWNLYKSGGDANAGD